MGDPTRLRGIGLRKAQREEPAPGLDKRLIHETQPRVTAGSRDPGGEVQRAFDQGPIGWVGPQMELEGRGQSKVMHRSLELGVRGVSGRGSGVRDFEVIQPERRRRAVLGALARALKKLEHCSLAKERGQPFERLPVRLEEVDKELRQGHVPDPCRGWDRRSIRHSPGSPGRLPGKGPTESAPGSSTPGSRIISHRPLQ